MIMIDIEAIRQSTRLVRKLPDELVSQAQRNVIALLEEIDRLREALADLRKGIEEQATDTVWYSPIETACDRITAILAEPQPGEQNKVCTK